MCLYGANAPNFWCKLSFTFALFLKVSTSKSWEPISKSSDNEKVTRKCAYLRKIMLHFLKFYRYGRCFASVQCGRLDLMDIPKSRIKCCRWCCRTNIIVQIWVSVGLLFHKCLHLLRHIFYTVSIPHVNNDAVIVAHICYISLLRCNYYDEYLACKEEDFCEWYILLEGDWELLESAELFYWKLLSCSLTTIEKQSQFRRRHHLISEYKIIYFLIRLVQTKISLFIFSKNLVIRENECFLLVEPCSRVLNSCWQILHN